MVDINTVSITGFVEHLHRTPGNRTILEVYQNVLGKDLTKFLVIAEPETFDELKELKIRKKDRIMIVNAFLYGVKNDNGREELRVGVLSPKQITVIDRKIRNRGEKNVDDFI